jgi:signal transduction histidine kinase
MTPVLFSSVRSWIMEQHIQSAAVAPLTVRDKVLGTLLVVGQAEGKGKFTQPDLDLLVAFANQAAIAIENATLYKQSKQLAVVEERSRLARELHDAVTQTLFSASLVAEALPATWERDPRKGGATAGATWLVPGALAEMRTLLLELRPAAVAERHWSDLLRQLGEATSGRRHSSHAAGGRVRLQKLSLHYHRMCTLPSIASPRKH